jgi:uncharacterized protein (DUF1800 family)
MTKFAKAGLYLLGVVLSQAPSAVRAQAVWWTNPPPVVVTNLGPDWTHQHPGRTNAAPVVTTPPVWTNLLHGITSPYAWGTSVWWTNSTAFTNPAPSRTVATNNGHGIIAPGQTPSTTLPRDVQTLLQQFQQQRKQLMNSLQEATDAQRQQILQQLQSVRDQLLNQLQAITTQAREQAVDMRGQFGGHFAPGNSSGGGPGSSGHGGKPRP